MQDVKPMFGVLCSLNEQDTTIYKDIIFFVLCPTFHEVKNQVIRRCRSESMPITVRHVTREQAANNEPANHPTLQNYSTSKYYITTQRYTTIPNSTQLPNST